MQSVNGCVLIRLLAISCGKHKNMPVESGGRPQPFRQSAFQQIDRGGFSGAAGETREGSAFSRFLPRLNTLVDYFPEADRQTRIDEMGTTMNVILREARGVPEVEATALKLKWAYHAFTFREQGSYYQGKAIREYNEYQAENGTQGNVVRGVEIRAGEEKQTFLWMLSQAGIPHNLGEGDICIPFLPMEREMQRTIRRETRRWASRDR